MKLTTILKTAAFATATMLFLSCSSSDDDNGNGTNPIAPGPGAETGVINFSILGEDIPYQNLEFTGNLSSAKIDYAYMLVKDPTLHAPAATRHAGEKLPGKWAVDLMAKDANRTPIHLGYHDVPAGSYEDAPKISIAKAGDWVEVEDKGGKAKLQEKNVAFLFGGTFVDADGVTHKYEVREPLPTFPITISKHEIPNSDGSNGTPLYLDASDTLLAEFHPHIDHALEVLDENPFNFSALAEEGDVIIFSDVMNRELTTTMGTEVKVYEQIVGHINNGEHWDVNVIPDP